MRSFLLRLFLAGLAILPAHGQDGPKRVRAEMLTVDDGLPQGLVWAIVQDRQGFLWFATKDGLVRYDGYEFRVFRNVPGDSTSLADNHITALHEDRAGFLWVGTERDGLHRYDPATGRFARAKCDRQFGPMAGIVSIEEDIHGDIWLHEYTGKLCVLPGAVGSPAPLPTISAGRDHYPGLDLNDLRAIRSTPHGDLWILERNELSVWTRTDGRFVERFRWEVPWPWTEQEYTPSLLLPDSGGRVLLVWERNVVVFDAATYAVVDTLQMPAPQLRGNGLMIDGQDRLWGQGPASTWFRMDLGTGRSEFLKPELEGGRSIPGTGFLWWGMDRTGIVWVGTPGYGVVKYRSSTERFHTIGFEDGRIGYSAIVAPDPEGTELLVQKQLLALNAAQGNLEPIAAVRAMAAQGLEPAWGICARDPNGRYWMGGVSKERLGSLMRCDPPRGELAKVAVGRQDNIAAVYPGLGHTVWTLSNDPDTNDRNWLTRIDTRTSTPGKRFAFPAPIRSGTYREIACWRFAADSTIWMATGNGVYGLDPNSGRWSHYVHREGDTTSLPGNEIFSLCFDPDRPERYLWVGTEGKGLARMEMRTGKCDRVITTEQGLPNNVVYGILPDAHRNLWISTNQGLCRFDPRTGAKKTYTKADGIAGNEFNRYSAERCADGTLYLGGMEGITWFDPEDFYGEAVASPTLITGLKLLNTPITVRDNASFLPVPITGLKELVLPYSERMITFAFASMDHSVPRQNEYRYILEGLNRNWIENGTGHEATFTNLDPGSYTFRVQGRNSEGRWDEVGASLLLTITPPWWATWWFRALVALALTAVIIAFFRYRLARALEVVNVRDQIARDLHDEIGSTLSSVALYSSVARKKAGDKVPEASEMLGRITESTTAVMEAMNDIVWAVNAENDSMDNVVKRMRSYAVQLTDATSCTLGFHIGKGIDRLTLGMAQRKNVYLIFKEAMNNAVKYAEASALEVDLSRTGSEVVLRIVDNGKGFTMGTMDTGTSGGNGLGNMQKRAAALGGELGVFSTPGSGTIIELRFRITNSAVSLDPMMDSRVGQA